MSWISLLSLQKLAHSYHKLTASNYPRLKSELNTAKTWTQRQYLLQSCCRVALGRYCILPANWICITVWFPFFSFPLLLLWFAHIRRVRQKELKLLWRTRHRSLVPVEKILWKFQTTVWLWHERSLNRNENHSRLTPCQLQRLCSEITWHIISACCCKQGGKNPHWKDNHFPVSPSWRDIFSRCSVDNCTHLQKAGLLWQKSKLGTVTDFNSYFHYIYKDSVWLCCPVLNYTGIHETCS